MTEPSQLVGHCLLYSDHLRCGRRCCERGGGLGLLGARDAQGRLLGSLDGLFGWALENVVSSYDGSPSLDCFRVCKLLLGDCQLLLGAGGLPPELPPMRAGVGRSVVLQRGLVRCAKGASNCSFDARA